MKLGIENRLSVNFILSLLFVLVMGVLFFLLNSEESKTNLRLVNSHKALNIFEESISDQYKTLELFNDYIISRGSEKIKEIKLLEAGQQAHIIKLKKLRGSWPDFISNIKLLNAKIINSFDYYNYIFNIKSRNPYKVSGVLQILAEAKKNTDEVNVFTQKIINSENTAVNAVSSEIENLKLTARIILFLGILIAVVFLIVFYRSTKKEIINKLKSEYDLKVFGKAVKSINESIVITDNKDKVLFFNEAFKQTYGYSEEELSGKDISVIYSKRNSSQLLEKVFDAIHNGGWSGELIHTAKDGSEFIVRISVSAVKDDEGRTIASVNVINDITESKKTEEEIERYIEELQVNKDLLEQNAEELIELNVKLYESEQQLKELNDNKDKFFSIISHDLRSPFNSLIGLSDILTNDIDSLSEEEIKYFSNNIHNTSKGVLNLVDNLLQWSRLQTGKIDFAPAAIPLFKMVDEISEVLKGYMIKKNISLRNEVKENTIIFADENMVISVLQNLISNALKFTDENGSIIVSDKDAGDFTEVHIKDNGVGMTGESTKKLFNIGTNSTTLGTAKEKGTGLGLILCKEMVEKHKGKIWVNSEIGKGTTFIFTVPKDGILQNNSKDFRIISES